MVGAGTFAANSRPAHECRRSCSPTFSTPLGLEARPRPVLTITFAAASSRR